MPRIRDLTSFYRSERAVRVLKSSRLRRRTLLKAEVPARYCTHRRQIRLLQLLNPNSPVTMSRMRSHCHPPDLLVNEIYSYDVADLLCLQPATASLMEFPSTPRSILSCISALKIG